MRVSIAISTWNRADSLTQTLASLLRLTIPAGIEWEVLVVNNACTDQTDRVLESWTGRLPVRRLFEPKSGLSFARNLAIRESAADLMLWTDDDVLVDPDWMKTLVEAFATWNADVVFGRSEPYWKTQQPDWFSALHYGRFAVLDYGKEPFVVTNTTTPFYGLNFAVRREMLNALGGFDESLGYRKNGGAAGGDDTDLCQRALDAGMKIVYAPQAVVQHMIPEVRATKQFYRTRLASALDRDYELLRESFHDVAWTIGLPRFMFRLAAGDAIGYVMSQATRAHDKAFDYELKLRRFVGYLRVAARRRYPGAAERSTL